MLDILTKQEIKKLTGYIQKAAQKTALNRMGIEHKERMDGSLVVAREHVLSQLGCGIASTKMRTASPNWDAI